MSEARQVSIITIPCVWKYETEDAYLVCPDEGPKEAQSVWVPKSLSQFDQIDGGNGELQVEEWFAIKAEMI